MNILITGANKGLGLEFVKQYSEQNHRIFACCRNPESATELNNIAGKDISVHKLEVTSSEDIANLKKELGSTAIDILIQNAGVYGNRDKFGDVNVDVWMDTMKINVFAPLKISEAFADNVAASEKKTIAIITSKMGSISDNTSGGAYIYRSSKAAVNMVGKSIANDLKNLGITVILLHPGWVATDMGGPNAFLQADESIAGMCKVIDSSSLDNTGMFWNYDGKSIDW